MTNARRPGRLSLAGRYPALPASVSLTTGSVLSSFRYVKRFSDELRHILARRFHAAASFRSRSARIASVRPSSLSFGVTYPMALWSRVMLYRFTKLATIRRVLERRLLPAVEDRRIQPVLIAQVRHRHSVKQMSPRNGCLFLHRKRPSLLRHNQNLFGGHMLTVHEALSNSD